MKFLPVGDGTTTCIVKDSFHKDCELNSMNNGCKVKLKRNRRIDSLTLTFCSICFPYEQNEFLEKGIMYIKKVQRHKRIFIYYVKYATMSVEQLPAPYQMIRYKENPRW